MRSETFGYCILCKIQKTAEALSKEHDPKKIDKLMQILNGLYKSWADVAERRKERRK